MATTTSGALFAACGELLGFCAQILAALPAGEPSRVFVSNGEPPFDCPSQLTVHAPLVGRALVAPAAAALDRAELGFPQLVRASLVVTVIRPVPVVREAADVFVLPDADAVTASSETCMSDVFALYEAILREHRVGTLLAPAWRVLDVGDASAVPAQGGATGWQIPLAVQLDAQID